MRTDPRYLRPNEVDELRGDASKAARVLGWTPRTRFPELVRIMLEADLRAAGGRAGPARRRSGRLMAPIDVLDRAVRVMVTGGGGFLGQAVVRELRGEWRRPGVRAPQPRTMTCAPVEGVRRALADGRPDVVIHLAAVVGGIGANREHPGSFFYQNAIMGIQLMEEARLAGVARYLTVGTVCSYPKFTPVPFREETLWDGYPEETNAPYGLAKKMLLVQSQAYRERVRLRRRLRHPREPLRPRRQLRPRVARTSSRRSSASSWTPTSGVTRRSRSGAPAPRRASSCTSMTPRGASCSRPRGCDSPEPVNLGVGHEITIRELVERICELVGYRGTLTWDTTKPDGQPRRALDTSRARAAFGFSAQVPFEEGLRRTIDWWRYARVGTSPAEPRGDSIEVSRRSSPAGAARQGRCSARPVG